MGRVVVVLAGLGPIPAWTLWGGGTVTPRADSDYISQKDTGNHVDEQLLSDSESRADSIAQNPLEDHMTHDNRSRTCQRSQS